MKTPTTPEHARKLADQLDDRTLSGVSHPSILLRSLAQQVEALTDDLSAEKLFSKQAMESVTEIAAQRDALTAERDDYRVKYNDTYAALDDCARENIVLTAERDEWKSKHFAFKDRDDMRNDAELYRHLRDHFAKTATDAKAEFARLEPLTGAQFDAVVRASIDAMGVEA